MYVNMGGTAIGTCINADESYVSAIVSNLSAVTGLDLRQAKNLIDSTQNLDCFVTASSTNENLCGEPVQNFQRPSDDVLRTPYRLP